MDIAEIGRRHLADALSGELKSVDVEDWVGEDGAPVTVFWSPLTGAEQMKIDAAGSEAERIAMILKVRAKDADGRLIYADTALASLINDYDFDTVRALAFVITAGGGKPVNKADDIEKE